ncbi:MAG: Exodeoxyribonuclease [Patescibacteria group bacterium]|nr:Exodeoxyribonuclease [Patescibacteria group bacterium]
MQFAGQRTDMQMNPIGQPINVLVRLSDDVLPSPDAILVTGITPQQTIQDGITEVEFLKLFYEEVALSDTIFVGFNSVRFDDEFMRFLHYRNFYDPYQWQWQDGRSRWDLLDAVRMMRALRPEGIKWPMLDGKPTNRLELLTKENTIAHDNAHDAQSDVRACIALAKLMQTSQPRLFAWLLELRDKKAVAKLVEADEPFVYSSGKYDDEHEKTTVGIRLAAHPNRQGAALVYDLRHDPTEFFALSPKELAERWQYNRDPEAPSRLPVKTLQYNRCPAIAPLGVLDDASQERIHLSPDTIKRNLRALKSEPIFAATVIAAVEVLDDWQQKRQNALGDTDASERLYDGFLDTKDQNLLGVMRAADATEIMDISQDFHDERLRDMSPSYKARNFKEALSNDEREAWEKYRYEQLMSGGAKSRVATFMHRLQELAQSRPDQAFLLEELHLYAESIMPSAEA